MQKYVWFSPLTSRLESFDHKYTPSSRPWTETYYSNSSWHENGRGIECWKVDFLEYLGRGTVGNPFTFQPTFWHSDSPTNIHSHTVFLFFFHLFFFKVQEDFFKVPRSHIKARKWHLKRGITTSKWHALLVAKTENVHRSTLIYSTWHHTVSYS